MEHITKRFGSVVANRDINLELRKGEILSLLGENGSGKTTLMNMLSGIYYSDEGQIYVNDKPVTIASPKDAFDLGIGMIHQHFKLVDVFTATENIVLGLDEPGRLDLKKASQKILEICERYGFEIDLNRKIYEMSVSQKQTVEIVKVLYRGAEILILDEPTAVLTPQETDKLFTVMRNMKADGKSLIIITHKLHEVLEVSDRVAVLRKGEYIGDVATKDASQQSLTDMMVGHSVSLNIRRPEPVNVRPRLEVQGLTVYDELGVKRLSDVSFTANAGEILGIAGIAGSGQRELLEAISGLYPVASGSVTFHPVSEDDKPAADRKDPGAGGHGPHGHPPVRRLHGLCAGGPAGHGTGGLHGHDRQHDAALLAQGQGALCKPAGAGEPGQPHLEGAGRGHPQHLVPRPADVRRQRAEGAGGPGDRPGPRRSDDGLRRRGLDINTSYTIYNLLTEEKMKGVAVVYVGEDLDVLLELCDRILVLCGGQVSGIVDGRTADKRQVGVLMTHVGGGGADV